MPEVTGGTGKEGGATGVDGLIGAAKPEADSGDAGETGVIGAESSLGFGIGLVDESILLHSLLFTLFYNIVYH